MDLEQGEKAEILVVRGPIAVGKTSVVQELARMLDKVALVPTNWLRHMVAGWSPDDVSEAVLAARNAALLAESYCQEGYRAIIDGPFDEPAALAALQEGLQCRRVVVVTLMLPWKELLVRHEARPENQRTAIERVRSVFTMIEASREQVDGVWMDVDGMSAADVAEDILPLLL